MMKSVLRILGLALLVLAVSCKKEAVIPDPAPETKTLHYKATVQTEIETRATVGNDLKYAFEEGDRVYMESVDGDGNADGKLYGFLSLSVTGGVGKTRALFEGDLTCAKNFTPSHDTPVNLVLVSAEDHLHTVSDGKVTKTVYTNKWESSLQEAVRHLSHFTGTGDFGSTNFTLAQQSSFLIVSLAFESNVGSVNAKLYKNYGSDSQNLLHEVSCETANVGGEIEASWVAAFPDDTEVTDASLVVTASGVNVPPLKMANATLQANTYYSFQRDTYMKDYFAVEAIQDNTEVTFNYATATNGIQYSLDGYQWNKYENPITLEAAGDKVYFRGKGTSFKGKDGKTLVSIADNNPCYVYGDIMFLMCEGAYKPRTAIPENNAFKEAFKGATWLSIKEGKELKLSANVLKESCYESMFYGCSSLSSGVSLPEEIAELPKACYRYMFQNSGIKIAPSVSATSSVGVSACESMFNTCEALTTIPGLTVSNVGQKGCYQMFKGCTSLSSVSFTLGSLAAATTGNHEGCKQMFFGCTSLTSAEGITLTASTLYDACYYSMFEGCEKLASAPALPATSLAKECYRQMFKDCKEALTSAPALNATTLAEGCYYSMFKGCSSLSTSSSPIFLPASTLVTSCYNQMFDGATYVNEVICLATDISADNSTHVWLNKVAATGIFWKVSGVEWGSGASAIPSGWTVKEYGTPIFPNPPFDGEEIDL